MKSEAEIEQLSLLTPEANLNPYLIYQQLRKESPVYWSESLHGWLITRYEDVWSALQDKRFSLGGGVDQMFQNFPEEVQQELTPLRKHLSQWMGTLDPPEHTRLRGVMNKGFTPALTERMRPFIKNTAIELFSEAKERSAEIDLVRDLSHPLPAIVIANMLGTPRQDHHLFTKWSQNLTEFLGFGHFELEIMRTAQETVGEMTDYLRQLLNKKRGNQMAKELLDFYLEAVQERKFRDEEELLANLVLLLFAGHETTSILLANSFLLLLSNPEQLQMLEDDSSLISSAVEEFLRFESPVQMIRRSVREDIQLSDKLIRKGDMVWLVLGSANRDSEKFASPDSLDIARRENRHLAFGSGIHYCLGAALSRVEAEETIMAVLQDLLNLKLNADKVERVFNPTARALKTLPVVWKQ